MTDAGSRALQVSFFLAYNSNPPKNYCRLVQKRLGIFYMIGQY